MAIGHDTHDASRVEAIADAEVAREQSSSDEKNVPAANDEAAAFVAEFQHLPPMTPEIEKRIKKKIDGWMIPLVSHTIFLCRRLVHHE